MDIEVMEALAEIPELEYKWCDECAGYTKEYAKENLITDKDQICDCK